MNKQTGSANSIQVSVTLNECHIKTAIKLTGQNRNWQSREECVDLRQRSNTQRNGGEQVLEKQTGDTAVEKTYKKRENPIKTK